MASGRRLADWLPDILLGVSMPLLAFFLARQLLSRLDPEAGAKQEAQQKALAASTRLQSIFSGNNRRDEDEDYDEDDDRGRESEYEEKKREPLTLTAYEQTIAMEVVKPSEIPVTFDDVGGLEDIIEELRESVIYPLTLPHLYSGHSSLLTAPSGVLLYGPPGCGKTMLAKALARESGACFINLHISTLTEKWYGDSNKLVAAVFSLARKLAPTIVFIDEIDAVLGQRRSGEHEASGMVKAEFMTHWDGLASATTELGPQRICVMGATNRIQDIDEAILRRLPKKFPVSLPNAQQRRQIFELTLRDTKIDGGRWRDGGRRFDLDVLVRVSAGMSGSDIKEACRDAAMVPVREYIKEMRAAGKQVGRMQHAAVRGLQTDDFFGRRGGVQQMQINMDREHNRSMDDRTKVRQSAQDDDLDSEVSGSTEEVDDFLEAEGEVVGAVR